MKKITLILSILTVFGTIFSFQIFIDTSYHLTTSIKSSEGSGINFGDDDNLDYMGGRISFLIPTEDTEDILYGPYIGLFYNHMIIGNEKFDDVNNNRKPYGISLGINARYKAKIINEINFAVLGYGGVNSLDLFGTFATEILIKVGLVYKNMYLTGGYETRYYKVLNNDNANVTVNYIPISVGVNFSF